MAKLSCSYLQEYPGVGVSGCFQQRFKVNVSVLEEEEEEGENLFRCTVSLPRSQLHPLTSLERKSNANQKRYTKGGPNLGPSHSLP